MTTVDKTNALITKWNKERDKLKETEAKMWKWLQTLLKRYYKKTKSTRILFRNTIRIPFELHYYTGIEFDKDATKMNLITTSDVFFNSQRIHPGILIEVIKEVTEVVKEYDKK